MRAAWILLLLVASAASPTATGSGSAKFECTSSEWRQPGMGEAEEGQVPILVPVQEYTAELIARTSPCTPTNDACGAPPQSVDFKLGPVPPFVHGSMNGTRATIFQDDPGNLEARVYFTYALDPETPTQTLINLTADASCPSGKVLHLAATFVSTGYVGVTARVTGSHFVHRAAEWTVNVTNAGNVDIAVRAQLVPPGDVAQPPPAFLHLRRSLFGGPTSSSDLRVASGRDVGNESWRLELTPYLLRDGSVMGTQVNMTLERPSGTLRSLPSLGAVEIGATVAAVALLVRPQRRT